MPTIIKTITSAQGGVKNYLNARSSSFTGWTNVGSGATGSTTTTAAELPELSVGTALKVTNGGSGSGYVESDFFQIDASDLGKLLGLTYNLETSSSPAYAANDFQIQVWDATTSGGTYAQNTSLNISNVPLAPTGGSVQATFSQNPSRPFTRIRIVRSAGVVNSWAAFSSITVTSATGGQGAAISDWQSYTPTFSATGGSPAIGNGTMTGRWRRVGSSAEIQIRFLAGSTTNFGSGAFTFSIPSGLTIDTNALPSSTPAYAALGTANLVDEGTQYFIGEVVYQSTTTVRINTNAGGSAGPTIPFTWVNADSAQLFFAVPISEWAGSGTVNLGPGAQVEYAFNDVTTDADTTSSGFAYGPQGALVPNISGASNRTKVVQFQYPIQADDVLTVEINIDPSNSNAWFDASQFLGTVGTTTGVIAVRRSGSQTQCDVVWGYSGHGSTLFASANTWATRHSGGWRWRVRKAKASSPVGFGLAAAGTSGLVSSESTGTASVWLKAIGGADITGPVTIRWTRVGKIVTVLIPAISASTANTQLTLSTTQTSGVNTWPTEITPARQHYCVYSAVSSTTYSAALIGINSSGVCQLFTDMAGSNFTGSTVVKGVGATTTITYMLD